MATKRGLGTASALLGLLALVAGGVCQGQEQLLERVIAVVDDEPILFSEVEAGLLMTVQSLGIDPGDSVRVQELRERILEQQIEQKVVYLEAVEEGVTVRSEEIATAVEDALARNREQIGSEEMFQIQLQLEGITEEELRERYTEQARVEITVARFAQAMLGPEESVTPEEVRDYYEENRGELPQREAAVNLQHILIAVRADSQMVRNALDLANDVAAQIRSGEISFADAARAYSDDPNGREGGDLHRIRRGDVMGKLGLEFEEALFSLEPNVVGAPVVSPLGCHLLLVHEKDPAGAWVHASHVLFAAPILRADRARADRRADEVYQRAMAGESFEVLAQRYSENPETAAAGGNLSWVPLAALGPEVGAVIEALSVGEIGEPIAVEGEVHIFRLLGRESERNFAFEEVEAELVQWVQARKAEERYRKWVEELKKKHYIERRL